jgi:hypothetical protein
MGGRKMSEGSLSKLAVIIIFSLALILCFASTAVAVDHHVAIMQSQTVSQIQNAIQTAIKSAKSGGTIIVTGGKSGADAKLTLDIPAGVKVEWKADYDGDAGSLIELDGTGTFEVTSGTISANRKSGYAIYCIENSITVTGTAAVQTNGNCAIFTSSGDVRVSGNATVVQDSDGSVTSYGIFSWRGNIIVTDNATVQAIGTAISVEGSGDVTVSGNATVQSSQAISTSGGKLTVSGGTVYGIEIGIAASDGEILVSGGTVSVIGDDYGSAICAFSSIVTVAGGMVSAIGNAADAIYSYQSDILVTGGTVSATGGCIYYTHDGFDYSLPSFAIRTDSGVVTVSGGTVSATGEGSIVIRTDSGDVMVSGGTIVTNSVGGLPIISSSGTVTVKDTVTIKEPEITLNSFTAFIQGFEDNTFRSSNLITKEQFIAILYRLKNNQSTASLNKSSPSYRDVALDRWSYHAIEWAKKAGVITEAYDDGNFHPTQPLTRAEMAIMLVKVDGLTKMADNTFSDLSEHTAKDDILKAVRAKIFTGYPDGSFKPNGNSTRAEAITALIRYLLGGEPADEMWQYNDLKFSDITRGNWAYKYIVLAVRGYEGVLGYPENSNPLSDSRHLGK